jgi:phosphonate transport system substrate-binding protein
VPEPAYLGRRGLLIGASGLFLLTACGSGQQAAPTALTISAIPDQDPEKLNRLYPMLAKRLADVTTLSVDYRPVADYTAVVRAFEIGDIYLAWMGGLTGVQARSRVRGATALAQRDIDQDFHSLFIANKNSGLTPFDDVGGLRALAGHTFTFGSETSTSGRLMPQYYMRQGGLGEADLKGRPGYSGSHDATIESVALGSFEAGAANEQVWKSTQDTGNVDTSNVVVLWRTPAYADYHWLARPDLDDTFGAGTTRSITDRLLGLDVADPADKAILELFGAKSFVATDNAKYDRIEDIAREQGLLT